MAIFKTTEDPHKEWADITHEVWDAEWLTAEEIWERQQNSGANERLQRNAPIEGQNIPLGRGQIKAKGKVMWARSVRKEEDKLYVDFVMHFFHNVFQKGQKLTKILMDDTIAFDVEQGGFLSESEETTTTSTQRISEEEFQESKVVQESTGTVNQMRVYTGIDNLVDPMMLARDGEEATPNYDGHVMIAFQNWDVTGHGGRIPIVYAYWADDTTRTFGDTESFDLISRPDSEPYILCYDRERKRGYLGDNVGVDAYIGTTVFSKQKETRRVKVTGFPEAEIGVLENAICLSGLNYILCTTTAPLSGKHYDLLINAQTGEIEAYLDRGTDKLVQWQAAMQQLHGVTTDSWIAGGTILQSPTDPGFPAAWLHIDLTNKALSYIEFGDTTSTAVAEVFISPGELKDEIASRTYGEFEGVTFLVTSTESRYVNKFLFTSTDPYDIKKAVIIGDTTLGNDHIIQGYGHYDSHTKQSIAISYFTSWDVLIGKQIEHSISESYGVVSIGGGWDAGGQTLIADVKSGTAAFVKVDAGSFNNPHTPSLFDFQSKDVWELPPETDIYIQSLSTSYVLDAVGNKWNYYHIVESTGDLSLGEVLSDFTTYSGRYTASQVVRVNIDNIFVKAVFMNSGGSVANFVKRICNLFSVGIVERGDQIVFVRKSAITADLGGESSG